MTTAVPLPRTLRKRRPVAIDLFAGAGGLSLGFEQAGFDVVAAVEYDAVHAATHLYNFPNTETVCRDVSKISGQDLLAAARRGYARHYPGTEWDGRVDAIIGGPPCQGFSSGGKRQLDDSRNQMLFEYVRLVEALRPRAFCLENVAGLLDAKFGSVCSEAFRRLCAAGYKLSGSGGVLNAMDFGVPQSRRRVIVLGTLDAAPAVPAPIGSQQTVTVSEAFEGLPDPTAYPELASLDVVTLSPADASNRMLISGEYARALAGLDEPCWDFAHPRNWDPGTLAGLRRTVHSTETLRRFGLTDQGKSEPKSRLFRLSERHPARTLRAGSGTERGAHTSPRPIHPTEDRVINVREAARLHGFPDWFRFHTTNWHGHRQVGNSVPPPLARAAAQQLIDALDLRPQRPRVLVRLGEDSLRSLNQSGAARLLGAEPDELPPPRWRSGAAAIAAGGQRAG